MTPQPPPITEDEMNERVGSKMASRIDPSRLNTRKLHHEAVMYLLRLCANLLVLNDANQPLRADPSTLEEWSTHRADLEECDEPIIRYTQYGQLREGELPKHGELVLSANSLIIELKLRNAGEQSRDIRMSEIENIERMAMQLDCRERVVFY